ncbi:MULTISPECIES: hypothetical protein [unclassified Bartonella]|uniref:hypothetical protein n=1 Tax=unclassified Bartonella TaxID=2645622 RepID=UPI0035D02AC7
MALFPFSIADIDDPECIRVVLYASGRMGHAPLNALLKKAYEDITKISKRVDALEKKLNALDLTNVEQKAKEEDQDNINSIVSGKITIPNIKTETSEIKIESSFVDRENFVSEIQKVPEIHINAHEGFIIHPPKKFLF